MLVSENIVKRWYQTDSPVYKNFVYLFDNPLWSKRVPNGFPVCPFFWLAMFSALIFQPFVFIIVNLIQPVIKTVGAPLFWLDRNLNKLLAKFGVDLKMPLGGATFITLVVGFFSFVAIMLVTALSIQYIHVIHPHFRPRIAFWDFVILVVAAIVAKVRDKNLSKIVLGWAFLSAFILGWIFRPELAIAGLAVLGFLWKVVCLFGYALLGLVNLILYAPWGLHVPIILVVVVPIVLLGLIPMTSRQLDNPVAAPPKPDNRDYTNEWLNIFLTIPLSENSLVRMITGRIEDDGKTTHKARWNAISNLSQDLIKDAATGDFLKIAQMLHNVRPRLSSITYRMIKSHDYDFEQRMSFLRNELPYNHKASDALKEVHRNTIAQKCADLVTTDYATKYQARLDNYERLEIFLEFVDNLFSGLAAIFGFILLKPLNFAAKKATNLGGMSLRFLAYLWIIAKSFKQGACPYLRFEDVSHKSESEQETLRRQFSKN